MIRAYRALVLMTFVVVVGCSSLTPSETPIPAAIRVPLYPSPETALVMNTLIQAYQNDYPQANFTLETRDIAADISTITETTGYFISHHLPAANNLWAAPLAQDALVLITHPDNPITTLTPDDVRRLYQGVVVNWRELNGDDMPVILFSREEGSSLRAEFDRLVMGQRRISPNARLIPSSAAAIESIVATPGGLAYIALSQRQATITPLAINNITPTRITILDNLYPLRMTLFIIGKREPTENEQPFITWVQSPAGQNILGQFYLPPIR